MHRARRALGLILLLGLLALFPTRALAAGAIPANWPGWHLQVAFLGLLAPLALMLLAVGATPPEESVEVLGTALTSLIVGVVVYAVCGFALQFGGLALHQNWPGLSELAAEWSPVNPALGLGWGVLGLRGFFLSGAAASPDALTLAVIQLPLVGVAVLIPTLGLARRLPRGILAGMAAVTGGLLYPIVGNWVWGGGWLSMLGLNLGWGHGFVDYGGSATLHFLGACVALAGILIFGLARPPVRRSAKYAELPPAYFPLFVLTGGLLAPIGWLGIVLANPLVTADLAPGLVAINLILAAFGGAAPGLLYSWLVGGRIDPQLTARSLLAGLAAGSAGCAFVPPFAAFGAGFLAGVLLPIFGYCVEHKLHWHDPNAILATHGIAGLLGALWPALFADGRWGIGWNGVSSPWGQIQQGVAGLLVAPGHVSDFPGQLWAQLTGLVAVAVLAVGVPMLLFGLIMGLRALIRLLIPAARRAVASYAQRR